VSRARDRDPCESRFRALPGHRERLWVVAARHPARRVAPRLPPGPGGLMRRLILPRASHPTPVLFKPTSPGAAPFVPALPPPPIAVAVSGLTGPASASTTASHAAAAGSSGSGLPLGGPHAVAPPLPPANAPAFPSFASLSHTGSGPATAAPPPPPPPPPPSQFGAYLSAAAAPAVAPSVVAGAVGALQASSAAPPAPAPSATPAPAGSAATGPAPPQPPPTAQPAAAASATAASDPAAPSAPSAAPGGVLRVERQNVTRPRVR